MCTPTGQRPLVAVEFFLIAALAKAVSTVLTYPMQLAQNRLDGD